uniref:Centromere protein K n=1 Tax=Amphilophus citrinellus TaxID=61819 RepID=A0A3Q0RA26_AMPCI
MHKLCSELEMVASCYEAKRDKLKETKELYVTFLLHSILKFLMHSHAFHSVLQDIKEKIQKMKVYQEGLMECLGYILKKHVPLPQDDSGSSKKKKVQFVALHVKNILMNKVLNTPHDPYVAIDDTLWPPYVEMLLRYGIAVRHQENNLKIRLETFF